MKPLALPRDARSLFLVVVGCFFVLALVARVLGRLAVRALQCPEEQRGEPCVFLDGAGRAVARPGLGGAEDLGEGAASYDFPYLSRYSGRPTSRPSAVSTFE